MPWSINIINTRCVVVWARPTIQQPYFRLFLSQSISWSLATFWQHFMLQFKYLPLNKTSFATPTRLLIAYLHTHHICNIYIYIKCAKLISQLDLNMIRRVATDTKASRCHANIECILSMESWACVLWREHSNIVLCPVHGSGIYKYILISISITKIGRLQIP